MKPLHLRLMRQWVLVWTFPLVLVLLLMVGCQQPSPPQQHAKPTVLVSLAPYAYVVKQLAPNLVQVDTLVPDGANPHLYEAPPKQVERHKKAALWICLGEGFDNKMTRLLAENASPIHIVDLTAGIELLHAEEATACHHDHSSHEGSEDRHLWLSPRILKTQAERIAAALIVLLPEEKGNIQSHLLSFCAEMDALDRRISDLLLAKKDSHILVSHPAFAYFCKDYGIHQLAVETEGKEPKPQDIALLLAHAQEQGIKAVITQPQHSNKGADAIAHFLGLSTEEIDPYAENCPETLLHLAQMIAQ